MIGSGIEPNHNRRRLMLAGSWTMIRRALALMIVSAAGVSTPTLTVAAETCHSQSGQYADTRTCVTSVLTPQGRNSYGPKALSGGESGAWCEGVAGPGIGQAITLHQKPENVIGSMSFGNGYAKTPEVYRANGRVKQAEITTSGGYRRVVTLKDTAEPQTIKISPSKVSWVRLTILEAYPGARSSDTCVTTFYLNQEDFLEGETRQ
jgi:hypothetical protein